MTPNSNPVRPTLEDIARDWLIARNAGTVDENALACWRQESLAHDLAYRDAERAWHLLGALGSSAAAVEASLPKPKPRKARLAMAACFALFALGLGATLPGRTWFADARTVPGQTRQLTLADGTHVALNGATALSWHIDAHSREIHLLKGEAFFTVAHDPNRPLVVSAGSARFSDIGTMFNVDMTGKNVELSVTQGEVGAIADTQKADVVAGHQIVVTVEGLSPTEPADLSSALAWQRGKMVFKARPLGQVVTELARYRPGYIVVVNDRLRQSRVTGVFDTKDSNAVLDAIAHALPAHVIRITPYLTIIG